MKKALLPIAVLLALIALSPAARAQDTVGKKYTAVQIERFEIDSDVQFPADYLLILQEEIIKQMRESALFAEVLRPGEKLAKEDAPVLRMTGKITKFKAGSRAERYFTMFGGSTEIFAHLVYLDTATAARVITDDVRGIMAGGFMGGESTNVTRDFAAKVVTSAKVMVHKRIGAAGATDISTPVDRQTLAFSSHDFPGIEGKLNEKGAAGYRLADFAVTANDSADVIVESAGIPGATFVYRVLHSRSPGALQQQMNELAGNGFHLSGPTVGLFGSVMTAILEKSSEPDFPLYTYRVHLTMRVSSAEKDTRNDQAEGYVLSGATHRQSIHLVVLEKKLEKARSK